MNEKKNQSPINSEKSATYHKLLERQLNQVYKESRVFSSEILDLLKRVSETYTHYEIDRLLLERSMEVSSRELEAANKKLSDDFNQQEKLLATLQGTLTELFKDSPQINAKTSDAEYLISIAELIKEQIKTRKVAEANIISLLNSTSDAIWSVNENFQLLSFNSSFSNRSKELYNVIPTLGMKPEDLFGFGSKETKIWKAYFLRSLEGKRFVNDRRVKINNQTFNFEISCNPIESEGEIVGITIFEKDITERKRVEDEIIKARNAAEEANQAKSEFLANMSHELRTPLNAIIGYGQLICENFEDQEFDSIQQDAKRIETAGNHLLELINEILDLSKIESGKMEIDIESFSIPKFLSHLENATRLLVEKNKNKFRITNQVNLLEFRSDRTKLNQVLLNLISNSAKFTENGVVELKVSEESSGDEKILRFDILDTGIGIPQEKINRLFKAFYQVDSSSTRKYGGTGLGLAIVQKFVELLQGEISIISEVGKGSTFTVRIPHQNLNLEESK